MDSATAPLAMPAGAGQRPGRGAAARRALTSRAAGWVVAAVLAGVIIGLSVSLARWSPTVAVAPAGAVRQFTIGPAGLPPGAAVVGPAGGAQHAVVVGPAGLPGGVVVFGPAGKAVVAGPPGKAVVVGPAGLPARAIVVCRPAGWLTQLVPPGVPVRVFLPGSPPRVRWWFVHGQQVRVQIPARAQVQIPASWAFPQILPPAGPAVQAQLGAGANVPAQVMVPPGQLRASLHVLAPAQERISRSVGPGAKCQSSP